MRSSIPLLLVFSFTSPALAASSQAVEAPAQRMRSFDPAALDRSVSPCQDFYQFACGGFIKNNPIPPDQSRWGRFQQLVEYNRAVSRTILETAAAKTKFRDPHEQKIGDYYATCMDEQGNDAKGLAPAKPYLDLIAGMKSTKDLANVLAVLHRQGIAGLFAWSVAPMLHNSARNASWFDQGGMALGNKDFYTNTDEKSVARRTRYLAHIAAMFALLGISKEEAKIHAQQVMDIEMKLALAAMTLTERRDTSKLDHWMSRKSFTALVPSFAWEDYFAATPKFSELNATSPDYFKALETTISSVALPQWKSYLTWHFIHSQANALPIAFGEENFNFYGKELSGTTQRLPLWKRCMRATDADLGEALGKFYVDVAFAGNAKSRALTMVHDIERAMDKVIKEMTWMGEATKKKALAKLQLLANKIGYPDRWRDYSALRIVRGDQLGNSLRANAFEINRRLAKIGKAVDKKEWEMTPPTVNAYYDPTQNNINFPAGILQPPFFDNGIDDAVNYGAIGVVIGHELTHGFDDQGSAFDGKGNLHNWWSASDKAEFEKYGACFVEQYAGFSPIEGVQLNGKLTLGENIADNGGAHLAYLALRERLKGKEPAAVDGFSADQRFWIGFAQVWCENVRPEYARTLVLNDPHAPGRFRSNGVASNSSDFAKAFACQAGDFMVRGDKACTLW